MSNQTVENCGFTSTLKKLEFKWSDENDDAEEEKQEEKGYLQHCRVQRRWGKWKVFENWWRIRRRLRRRGAPRLGASNRRAPTSPRSPPWMMNRSTDPKRRRSLVVETKRIEGTRARRLGIDRNRTLKQSLNSRIWSKVWIRSLSHLYYCIQFLIQKFQKAHTLSFSLSFVRFEMAVVPVVLSCLFILNRVLFQPN